MTQYVVRSVRRARALPDIEGALNQEQRAVVLAEDGPMLVIAGAGSGKTRTLTYRAAHLIACGLDPRHILLCTFTNRAAKEMLQRVQELLDVELQRMWAGTFHHVANLALRRYASDVGLAEDYSILDREDARDLMASCLTEEGAVLRARRFPQPRLLQQIATTTINCQLTPYETVCREAPRFVEMTEDITRVIESYSQLG